MGLRPLKLSVAGRVLWKADSQIEICVQGVLLGSVLVIDICGGLKEEGLG